MSILPRLSLKCYTFAMNFKSEFKKQFSEILFNEKLSKYSTFQIGGPADFFYKLKNTNELNPLLSFAKKHHLKYFIIGGGSNILFDDKGFRGLIIKIETKNITIKNTEIIADAGISIATLLNTSITHALTGLEPWIGLPGTVGGAVRGNAGCNGLECKKILSSATILNPKTNKIRTVSNKYFQFKYRQSKLKQTKEIVLNATFKLKKRQTNAAEQKNLITKIRKSRIDKQPFGSSTGSFFRNPSTNQPAGFLIEQVGLKGKTIGKAQISTKHANFLLNIGGATSQNIIKLANLVRKLVKAKFGLILEEEVQILTPKGPKKL